jgi:hypothetical protein
MRIMTQAEQEAERVALAAILPNAFEVRRCEHGTVTASSLWIEYQGKQCGAVTREEESGLRAWRASTLSHGIATGEKCFETLAECAAFIERASGYQRPIVMARLGQVVGPRDIIERLPRGAGAVRSWQNDVAPKTQEATRSAISKLGAFFESSPSHKLDSKGRRIYRLFVYRTREERVACFNHPAE